MIFFTSKIANNITEFKYRMEGDKVAQYDFIHPSFTFLTQSEVFSFCNVDYTDDFSCFLKRVEEKIELLNGKVDIEDEPNRDDRIFMTSIPWVSFTSVTHPINLSSVDSIPRIAWGKYFEENGKLKLPVSVQVNHSMMDGLHVGRYFSLLQDSLDDPSKHL
jgi:chloramphenicol O-acetyltransferase type A